MRATSVLDVIVSSAQSCENIWQSAMIVMAVSVPFSVFMVA